MIALDTETTGLDFYHGARPFLVTVCFDDDCQQCFEWEVDPYTREVQFDKDELEQIYDITQSEDLLILQNAKFDVTGLGFLDSRFRIDWQWDKTRDTIIAGHLLGSGYPHNLTDMVAQYLSKNIEPYEKKLEEACVKARRIAKRKFPEWRIAEKGDPMMPSAKEKCWQFDYWLPKAVCNELGYDRLVSELEDKEHHWDTVLLEYANVDSYFTLQLWRTMWKLLQQQDLVEIFHSRMKLLPIALKMEHRGITLSASRLKELREEYEDDTETCANVCVNIAADYKEVSGEKIGEPYCLTMPKAGNNKKLVSFVFDVLKLEQQDGTSLDKTTLEHFIETLPPNTPELTFITNLAAKRKRDTALQYMEGYQRYWIPLGITNDKGEQLWFCLHPSLNPTGTAHLRWSCKNPNEMNISKQKGFNLRYMFGPAPGREWWSLDYQNLELRIPTYEADEKDLIEVFERPKDPPYYGSYHLVIFDLLYPDIFAKYGKAVKELYESTFYQWIKNGNFAMIYGAQEKKADATYHVKGAYQKVRYRFPKIAKLADKQIAEANKTGGIHTIPDKTVNPRKGYPIMCARGNWGSVKPTLPLNYHVSGTAMWMTGKAMIRCDEKLEWWREATRFDGHLIMQVHDELVFDLPKSKKCPVEEAKMIKEGKEVSKFRALQSNLWRINILKQLMEKSGDDVGIPTPIGLEYNPETWDHGIVI